MPPEEWSHEQLLAGCATGGGASAWEEFVRRYHDLIARVVLRTAQRYGTVSPDLLEDLVQEVYLKLCGNQARILGSYREPHPDAVYGFLKVVVSNAVHDHFKAKTAKKRGAGRNHEPIEEREPVGRPAAPSAMASAEQRILLNQIDDVLNGAGTQDIPERDRRIFWLYYQHGWTAKAIASIPALRLTPKGVESTILRATRYVRARLIAGARPQETGG